MSGWATPSPAKPSALHGKARVGFSVREGQSLRNLISFLVGILCFVRFQVIGEVYVSEVLLAGLLPFLLTTRGHLLRNPTVLAFVGLIGLWLFAQVLTDVVRETDFFDYARGWANIVVFLVNACALYLLLYGSRRRFVLFAFGLALGKLLSYWLTPSIFAEAHPWKFGSAQGIVLLAILVPLWRPIKWSPMLATAPLLAVGIYSLIVGFRSMFACALIASLSLLAQRFFCRSPRPLRVNPPFLAIGLLAGTLLAALGTLELFELSVSKGYVDEQTAQTFEFQSQGQFGILAGGRSGLFAAIPAILDSPILGHGSKAKSAYYAARIMDARDYGYMVHMSVPLHGDLIPSHSMLFGTWVEAGIGGIFFWIWFALLIVAVLANLCVAREPLSLLIFYLGFTQLWHIPFSHFGGDQRLTTAFVLCLLVVVRQVLRNSRSALSGAVPLVPTRRPASELV